MTEVICIDLGDDTSPLGAFIKAVSLEAFIELEFGVTDATLRVNVETSGDGVFHSPERKCWPPIYRMFEFPPGVDDYPPLMIEVKTEDIILTHFIRDQGVLCWFGYGKGMDTLAFWVVHQESTREISRLPIEVYALLTGQYRDPMNGMT